MSSRTRPRFQGLWRHPDFLKLWTGQSVSVFGSLITKAALPIVAVLTLHANAAQVALIYAAQVAPTLAFGLFAGALADSVRRRPLLIVADVGRALTLASVPLAAVTGALSLNLIYLVTLLTSALSALFDIAYPAYLPSLIGPERLLEGNAKMGASMSVAEVAGFGLAGALVQALTASGAILVDIATYVVSIVSLGLIRTREPAPAHQREAQGDEDASSQALARLRRDVAEGLRLTWRQPTRRALAGVALVQALCG
ncbi:MAG TPA: MFS transporter, partial [Ktedonobacterales bacterium]